MPFYQEPLLQLILHGLGAVQSPATAFPPNVTSAPSGPNYASGLAQTTPAGAVQDERARLMAILGQSPQMAAPDLPDPQSLRGLFQTGLAGLADVLSAGAAAGPGGQRVEPTRAIAGLTALRQRREAILAANANAKSEAERDAAARQLDRLDREEERKFREGAQATAIQSQRKEEAARKAEIEGKLAAEADQLAKRQAFEAQQNEADRQLRSRLADAENRMRVSLADRERSSKDDVDKVANRQIAEEQRSALRDAKGLALKLKGDVAAGKLDPATARQQFQDMVEVDLDGPALEAALAWFDLKVGRPSAPQPDMTDRPPGIERHVKRIPESDLGYPSLQPKRDQTSKRRPFDDR